jgi:hypothetical protein
MATHDWTVSDLDSRATPRLPGDFRLLPALLAGNDVPSETLEALMARPMPEHLSHAEAALCSDTSDAGYRERGSS